MEAENRKPLLTEWVEYDLDRDIPRSPGHCPVARAIKESDPNIGWVKVGQDTLHFTYLDTRVKMVFRTPPSARAFLIELDFGGRPTPFMLVLRKSDLIKANYQGQPFRQVVIEHDGRGSGPRGPRMRPLAYEMP